MENKLKNFLKLRKILLYPSRGFAQDLMLVLV